MKKILAIGLIMLAICSNSWPAFANGPCNFNGCYGGHHHYHGNGGGGGDWAAPLIGGLIIGGILGNMAAQPQYQNPYYVPQTYCRTIPVYDEWGNWIGRQRQCWTQ